ncbi:MAG: Glu/Leu/Phe/Val dehydrogenase [Proteobacteria bacterium]|nr:Glu/Leu/Phe/Val dehydrogenase [Pseudomonadota bacterium]
MVYTHYPDFDGHELITSRQQPHVGLTAIIAIHNTRLGPAIGGCRMLKFPDAEAAITDVLRLSRGMTYKAAIAGIPYGGGKAVIMGNPAVEKTSALMHAMGEFVESLQGRFITSFDSGTSLEDVRTMSERTRFTAGALAGAGNASESTAYGVFQCLKVAVRYRLGRSDLQGLHIAIQGVGNVGSRLAHLLRDSGAVLSISDTDAEKAAGVAATTGAHIVDSDTIHRIEADVYSPCALGGVLSARTIGELRAKVVVGGANNQLAQKEDDQRLLEAGIVYCPDYLANAGGIIDVHYQRCNGSQEAVRKHIEALPETFVEVMERSRALGTGTGAVADRIAEERFGTAQARACVR